MTGFFARGMLLIMLAVYGHAGVVELDKEHSVYELGGRLEVLEDVNGKMDLDGVMHSDAFMPSRGKNASYGVTHSVYWARVTLHNSRNVPRELMLVQQEQSLDYWDVYVLKDGMVRESKKLGDMRPLAEREFPHRYSIALLSFSPGETVTLYMRHQATQSMLLSMALYEPAAFAKEDTLETLWFGLAFGIMVVMIVYNLFIWMVIRHRAYLYYVAYVSTQFVMQFVVISGFAYWLFPQLPLHWYSEIYLYAQNGLIFFTVLFTMSFLETGSRAPRLHKVLAAFPLLAVLFSMMHAVRYNPAVEQLNLLVALGSVFLMLFSGLYLWRKGFSAARFYVYAWIFYLGGTTVSLLGFMGVYGVDFWVKTAIGTGTTIEVTLISLALADKFRILREEREAAVRALMEESQKNARQQQLLVQQSKMAEIGEIFGMMAHQWKQPLSSIGLISELISEDSKYGTVTKENIAENTAKIKEQVRFMAQTITDFQNFLKPSAEGRRFDIRKALEEITSLVTPAVRSRNVTITLEADSLEVTGFRNEFMQVALNLINNAIESIETTKQDGKVLITAHKEGTKARITIEDNGSGIPEAARERLFELFATTKGEKGTGMGLYMSRIIVEEKMGGRLTLENLPDCGAAAVIELPAGN